MRLKLALLAIGGAFLLLTGFRPAALPFIPGSPYSDAVLSHWPAALYLRESVLERGEFPLWRDTILSGQPFAANPLNKTAYPLQWLALVLPPALHLDVMIVLHLLLAGWGMGRWLRALGLGREAAAVGALAYALSPRLIAHTGAGHMDLLYALAWWPFLMRAVYDAMTQARLTLRPVLRVALFAALVFLADVRASLFALSLAAFYALYLAARERHTKRLVSLAGALLVFAVLIVSVVVPLLLWSPYLSRAALSPADAGVFSLEVGQFAGLLALPVHRGTQELLTAVGLPVLALALVGMAAQGRRAIFWLAALLVAALYALGSNGVVWSALVRFVPAFLWFRVPARAWFVVALVVPLLAAYGVDSLLNRRKLNSRARLLALVCAVAGIFGGAFMLLALPTLRTAGVSWLLAGALAGVILLAGRVQRPVFAALLLGIVALELAWTGGQWLSWQGAESWLDPYRPIAERLIALDARRVHAPYFTSENDAVTGLPQQVAAEYGLSLFGGVDPFQLSGVVDAVRTGSGIASDNYDIVVPPLLPAPEGDMLPEDADGVGDTSVLAAWGVRYVVLPYRVDDARLELVEQVDDNYLYAIADAEPDALNAYGWPHDADALPDPATVAQINQWTLIAALISGVALVVVLVLTFLFPITAKTESLS